MKEKEDVPQPDRFEHLHVTMAVKSAEMLKLSIPFITKFMESESGKKIAMTFFELGPEKGLPILSNALHSWFSAWLLETQRASGVPVGSGLFEVKSTHVDGPSPFGMHDRAAKFDDSVTFGVMKHSGRMLECLKQLIQSVNPSYDADGCRTPSGGHVPQRVFNEACKIIDAVVADDMKNAADKQP